MSLGFYFDQTRCINCFTCVVACKDWHDIPSGPASWRKVITIEHGIYPQLSVTFLSMSCYHCAEPACIAECPASAINKRDDGIVIVDRDACLGKEACGICLNACPYGAPQFGAEENAKMQKCDLCIERWESGKPPICVAACPTRALDAAPIDKLKEKYDGELEAVGFEYHLGLKPAAVFKPKKDANQCVFTTPPIECNGR